MVEEKIKDWYYAHFMSNIGCRMCFKHSSFCASFADFHLRNGEFYFYSNPMPSDYCFGRLTRDVFARNLARQLGTPSL